MENYLNTSTEGIKNVKNTNIEATNRSADIVGNSEETCHENSNDTPDVIDNTEHNEVAVRRSQRIRNPPVRFSDYEANVAFVVHRNI